MDMGIAGKWALQREGVDVLIVALLTGGGAYPGTY